jgi:hypothetical protein
LAEGQSPRIQHQEQTRKPKSTQTPKPQRPRLGLGLTSLVIEITARAFASTTPTQTAKQVKGAQRDQRTMHYSSGFEPARAKLNRCQVCHSSIHQQRALFARTRRANTNAQGKHQELTPNHSQHTNARATPTTNPKARPETALHTINQNPAICNKRIANTNQSPDPPPCTGEESQMLSRRDHSMHSRIAPDPPPCTDDTAKCKDKTGVRV